jgi:hypothetical protein
VAAKARRSRQARWWLGKGLVASMKAKPTPFFLASLPPGARQVLPPCLTGIGRRPWPLTVYVRDTAADFQVAAVSPSGCPEGSPRDKKGPPQGGWWLEKALAACMNPEGASLLGGRPFL